VEFQRELQALIRQNETECSFLRNLLGLRVSARRLIRLQQLAVHGSRPESSATSSQRPAPYLHSAVDLCATPPSP
jgi:hypothetical protein